MPTEFQQRVFEKVSEIPHGRVVSYQDVAQQLGIRSAQAVGQALKRNPYAPEVPCHRVIRKDGFVSGYLGKVTIRGKKRDLLQSEGVQFNHTGVLQDKGAWWSWSE